MTQEELDSLREQLRREANVVEAMAHDEAEGLSRLRRSFLHQEFLQLLSSKKVRMEELAVLREEMRPLADRWVVRKRETGVGDPGIERELERIKDAFDGLRRVEEELQTLATGYLSGLTRGSEDTVQDRITLYRSWGG